MHESTRVCEHEMFTPVRMCLYVNVISSHYNMCVHHISPWCKLAFVLETADPLAPLPARVSLTLSEAQSTQSAQGKCLCVCV